MDMPDIADIGHILRLYLTGQEQLRHRLLQLLKTFLRLYGDPDDPVFRIPGADLIQLHTLGQVHLIHHNQRFLAVQLIQ
ncbi:hypothetical protein D3C71_1640330 [compost metagenome]